MTSACTLLKQLDHIKEMEQRAQRRIAREHIKLVLMLLDDYNPQLAQVFRRTHANLETIVKAILPLHDEWKKKRGL